MAVLLRSQHIARPPDLQIPHGDLDAGAQLRKFPDGLEPFLRFLFQHLVSFVHEKCIGSPAGTAYPPPELIQLRQAHAVRIVDDHGVGVGDVKACLDNGSGHQHVDVAVYKVKHDFLQLPFLHLSVGKDHMGSGHQFRYMKGHILDVADPVIHIIHLSVSGQLPVNGFPHHLVVVFHHIGLDGNPVHGRFLQNAHVPDPHKAHVEGPRDGCGRESEHVYILFQLFDLFLVSYSEPLLLIDDQKAQILEDHIL